MALCVYDCHGSIGFTDCIDSLAEFRQRKRNRTWPNLDVGDLLQFAHVNDRDCSTLVIRDKSETVVAANDYVVTAGSGGNLRRYLQRTSIDHSHSASCSFVSVLSDPQVFLVRLKGDPGRLHAGIDVTCNLPAFGIDDR